MMLYDNNNNIPIYNGLYYIHRRIRFFFRRWIYDDFILNIIYHEWREKTRKLLK